MAVTDLIRIAFVVLMLTAFPARAIVLPEDRVDALYHSYDGGGITVNGPSVLVRKGVSDNVSISANYYVDSISSASVDVVTTGASRYSEERTQQSIGVDYLNNNSVLSYSYTSSVENDFEATTSSFSIAQEMFGGLTTVSLGYKLGDNIVMNSTDDTFRDEAQTRGYRVTLSQVLTKNMLLGGAYEVITDEGFLNNPYRSIRYIDTLGATYESDMEIYPQTRTSNSIGFSLRYYLPQHAAIYGGYRYFIDSWEIEAHTYDVGYVYPYDDKWTYEFTYRFYTQTKAEFYSDVFPYADAQTYMARDKELSTHSSHSIGVSASYDLGMENLAMFEKGRVSFAYNYFMFNYDDFSYIPDGMSTTTTPDLYEFSASVIRLYLSLWF